MTQEQDKERAQPDWWRKRADEIEVEVARSGSRVAMRCYTDMRTLLQAATTAAPQPNAALADGWVDVPRDPTPAMAKAAADAWLDCGSRLCLNKAAAAVRAGIAAAPPTLNASKVEQPSAPANSASRGVAHAGLRVTETSARLTPPSNAAFAVSRPPTNAITPASSFAAHRFATAAKDIPTPPSRRADGGS